MGEKSTNNGDFARVWILGVYNVGAVWIRDKAPHCVDGRGEGTCAIPFIVTTFDVLTVADLISSTNHCCTSLSHCCHQQLHRSLSFVFERGKCKTRQGCVRRRCSGLIITHLQWPSPPLYNSFLPHRSILPLVFHHTIAIHGWRRFTLHLRADS